jgi:hypothetical protein
VLHQTDAVHTTNLREYLQAKMNEAQQSLGEDTFQQVCSRRRLARERVWLAVD